MNNKNLIGIAFLIVAVAFAIQTVKQPKVEARQIRGAAQQQNSGRQFAILTIDSDKDVTWAVGGNNRVVTESVSKAHSRLGGSGADGFIDLLNVIGSNGWNLVQKDGNVWIFTR